VSRTRHRPGLWTVQGDRLIPWRSILYLVVATGVPEFPIRSGSDVVWCPAIPISIIVWGDSGESLMISRRDFLHSTVLVLGAATYRPLAACTDTSMRIITRADCAAGTAFRAALSLPVDSLFDDAGALIAELATGLDVPEFDACFGLTRAPEALLFRQVLLERGMAENYLGDHVLEGCHWRHRLRGARRTLTTMAHGFASADNHWATSLAGLTAHIAATTAAGAAELELLSPAREPDERFPILVSWSFHRSTGLPR